MDTNTAVIIGAGPAGLAAAHQLLSATDIKPIIYEASHQVGGISRTVVYKGNRIDIGGHRYFSKSDVIMRWWLQILPMQAGCSPEDLGILAKFYSPGNTLDHETHDNVMLVRPRVSRILFEKNLFDYPISLNLETLDKLGIWRIPALAASVARSRAFPIKNEVTLEDFFINRFGRELYKIFFKDYTEKVWGVPCSQIRADWGAQRVKGVSITRVLADAIAKILAKRLNIAQTNVETSLIEQFMYPKLGAGQLWEELARRIEKRGAEIRYGKEVVGISTTGSKVTGVRVRDTATGEISSCRGDWFFSTMPVKDLVRAFEAKVPAEVKAVSESLVCRLLHRQLQMPCSMKRV